ncbi:hypothetical protein CS535_13810, partial [Yersinia massiliensis]
APSSTAPFAASMRLIRPAIFVGNFSDCAQGQKTQDPRPKTQDLKVMVLTLKFKSTFELPNEERRQGKRAGRPL